MPRVMEITTPLGDDVLLFHGMHAREELGRLSEYQLDLLSPKNDINPDDILGKNVTVKLALPDDSMRYFNGFVTRFAQGGSYGRYIRYSAVVHPWLWFLTRTTDCRIFQEMTVPDIVKKVFGDHPDGRFQVRADGHLPQVDYCVQYRETDFNFVSAAAGRRGHLLLLPAHRRPPHGGARPTPRASTRPRPGYEKITFIAPEKLVRPELEHISSWDFSRAIQPGVYVHDDYDLERPSVELKTRKVLTRQYAPSDYEIYDYPGHYLQKPDGEQYADVRINEFGTQFETAQASSNSKGIHVGSLFTLDDYPRDDQNAEHLILSASYDLEFSGYEAMPDSAGTSYRCSFVAMSSKSAVPAAAGDAQAVRPGTADGGGRRPWRRGDLHRQVRPREGPVPLGSLRQEGREQLVLDPRLAPWAGKAWGTVSTPRIGQEVIVDFLEGDPDQPIITGRVYNAEQMPPYDLPANKTQSGMKSRSSMGGGPANFNEIRFEDKKGSEQVFIHAEKNQDIEVEHDETHWVGHDRTKTIDHDETSHIKHDRTETVDNNETITVHGQRTETVDKNETITVHMNRTETVDANETITIGGNRTITVSKSETATVALQRTHTVGINETITVGAAQEITVGAAQAVTVGAAQTVTVGANQSTTVGAASIGRQSARRKRPRSAPNASMTRGRRRSRESVAGGGPTSIGKDDATQGRRRTSSSMRVNRSRSRLATRASR